MAKAVGLEPGPSGTRQQLGLAKPRSVAPRAPAPLPLPGLVELPAVPNMTGHHRGDQIDIVRRARLTLEGAREAAADEVLATKALERGGHALRHVNSQGIIKTVAGTGRAGLGGDGGPALAALLNGPKHACLDHNGAVIIADAENHVIRRYDPKSGTISRVAGTGKKGTAGLGGDPLNAELNRPHGVTIGPEGALYIVDSYNNRVLKLVP